MKSQNIRLRTQPLVTPFSVTAINGVMGKDLPSLPVRLQPGHYIQLSLKQEVLKFQLSVSLILTVCSWDCLDAWQKKKED